VKNLELNLGKPCNNRCVFCATGEQSRGDRGWMDTDEVERSLRQGREEGAESVGFVGGEPTLYRELPMLVALARELGYTRVSLCTNGRRLAREPLLESLLDAGLTRVAMSVHSHRAALEDRITGRPGAFDEKLAALALLTAARDAGRLPDGLSLNTVLHAQNAKALPALARFFQKRGVGDIRFNFIRPEVPADEARRWVPTFTKTTPRVRELVLQNETKLGLRLTLADFPLCRLPWELLANPHLRHRYLGEPQDPETRVAMHRPADRGGTKRFDWQEQRVELLKQYVPACDACTLRSRCEGIWRGYVDLYGDAEFVDGPTVARTFRGR
jgi:MoaA/NifB/PqqE/SkfB family radical SAM enzyme